MAAANVQQFFKPTILLKKIFNKNLKNVVGLTILLLFRFVSGCKYTSVYFSAPNKNKLFFCFF
ncbi:MAG TPA: hypothetical protein DCL52_00805 [Flavobacteriaceae bacterium]|nr:hypothetical protein [Flavobacteriaceae bacterium]